MPRLFTSIPIPSDIAGQLAKFRQPLPGARWLEPADFHLTLRFAGDVDSSAAREFSDNLSRINLHAFEITLEGFGVFGGHDPHTLWAGVSNNPALNELQRATERAARSAGLPPEPRQFKPHVTIARFRSTRVQEVVRFLERNASAKSASIEVENFLLMSAKPRTGGGPYVVEQEFPLTSYFWDEEDEAEYGIRNQSE